MDVAAHQPSECRLSARVVPDTLHGAPGGSGAIRGRYEQWVDDLGLVSGYKASSAAQTTGAVAKLMGSFPI
jgi:hypothetical protein